jgi:putative phosphoribosyl transferase
MSTTAPLFRDRAEAGEQLAQYIQAEWQKQIVEQGVSAQPIVYALPRGGIPVALPVAMVLGSPIDIVVAKKISLPENPELAVGAVTSDGHVLWSQNTPFRRKKSPSWQSALSQAQEKARNQLDVLLPSCPNRSPQGAITILVDDGIATGMTIVAAALALKAEQPAQVWICAPVAPEGIKPWLQQCSDRVILLETPHPFFSVSRFYAEFPQVDTEEAKAYLQQYNKQFLFPPPSPDTLNSG